jgi:putative DNA methylase
MTSRKKLIEVALPLAAINQAAEYEKKPGIGPHPRGLHHWWARRPFTAARAVIFAQMVDDPSANPDLFTTEKAQERERQRLFKIIEDLVQWENTTNKEVLEKARAEIWQSWRRACADNVDHPRAKELFDRNKLPAFHDPFAGGGALPLEAQRLGLEAYASDLNPVAVLINKAMIEIPPKFADRPPVNPKSRAEKTLAVRQWKGAQGLAEDVRYYGEWMRDEAEKRIGYLYPKIEITAEMAKERPDLKPLLGRKLTVIAWLWARTVKSPNPAFRTVDVPLASTFMLSTKPGKEAWVEPVIEDGGYRFTVQVGKPKNAEAAKRGTSAGKWSGFRCLMSDVAVTYEYIRGEGTAGRIGSRLMAVVAEGVRSRVYLSPTPEFEAVAGEARPIWSPELEINHHPRDIKTQIYGLTKYGDLFTPRQLVALTTFSDLIQDAVDRVRADAVVFGLADDQTSLNEGGHGAPAYSDAIALFLAFALSRAVNFNNSLAVWAPTNEKIMFLFSRQAIPMVWFFGEANLIERVVGGFTTCGQYIASCLERTANDGPPGIAFQADAVVYESSGPKVISTDPPYYDNIGYADLSDYFMSGLDDLLLALINETLDQVLAEQEGDFDADTRGAVAWFEQQGFGEGEFGVAETLSKAKNTSVRGLVEAGIVSSNRGKVRLLKPDQLSDDWGPATDPRLTAWEIVHQLIRSLESGGESAAASLVAKLAGKAEIARELAYRLYTIAERKKRATEALSYNGLVQSWPEIRRLARETSLPTAPAQSEMFG